MIASILKASEIAAKRLLTASFLAGIGLLVGATCVFFPAAIPFGVVALSGLILLWVMPDLASVPVELARIIVLPFIISIISIPAYYAVVFQNAPWISIRRILLFSLVAAFLIIVSGSRTRRHKLLNTLKVSPWLSFFVLGYFVALTLASLVSTNPGASISELINTALNWYIPMLAIIVIFDSEEDLTNAINTMMVGLIINFVLGAVEYYVKHPYLYMALPSWVAQEILRQNPIAPVAPIQAHSDPYRAGSIFNVALSWSEFAMMMAPFALQLILFGRKSSSRILGCTSFIAVIGSLAMSGSRGGYVGFLADSGLFIFACVVRYISLNRHSIWGALATIVFAIGSSAVAAAVLFVPSVTIKVLGGGARAASDQGRHEQWALAWPKFYSRPILGYGPGNALDTVGWISPSGFASLDSYIINVLISSGIVGIAFFYPMLLLPAFYSLKGNSGISNYTFSIRCSLSCSLFGYTAYRTSLNQIENNTLVYVMLGLIFVVNTLAKNGEKAVRKEKLVTAP